MTVMDKAMTVMDKLYQFDELSDEAKQRAREWFVQADDEFFDAESMTDTLKHYALASHGINRSMDCEWDLSYCGDDHVSFYGYLDFPIVCKLDDGSVVLGDKSTLKLRQTINALVAEADALSCDIFAHVRRTDSVKVEQDHNWESRDEERWQALPGLVAALGVNWPVESIIESRDIPAILVLCDFAEEQGKDVSRLRNLFG